MIRGLRIHISSEIIAVGIAGVPFQRLEFDNAEEVRHVL